MWLFGENIMTNKKDANYLNQGKIHLDGYSSEEVYLLYEENDKEYVVVKTFVDEKYRGRGLAKQLMGKFLKHTLPTKKISATCSYAQKYLLTCDDERIDKKKISETKALCRL